MPACRLRDNPPTRPFVPSPSSLVVDRFLLLAALGQWRKCPLEVILAGEGRGQPFIKVETVEL